LAIVKRQVDAMGGTVRVVSELGQGAMFVVELDAA
jgi:signal transduction histidine kinase